MYKRAQAALAGVFIGLLIAVIIGVGVVIPVITETIENASLTGMTGAILGYLPVMIAIVLFVSVAGVVMVRKK